MTRDEVIKTFALDENRQQLIALTFLHMFEMLEKIEDRLTALEKK
jgi:hypothetical protein